MGSTTVQAPPPINPAQVGAESLETQLRLAPQVYQAEALYGPQYARLQQDILAQTLPGMLDMYGQASGAMSGIQTTANTAQRTADIADVTALGGSARAAFEAANPGLTNSMASLNQNVSAARNTLPTQLSAPVAQVGALQQAAMASSGRLGPAAMASAGQLGPALGYDAAQMNATMAANSPLTGRLTGDALNYSNPSALQGELERQAQSDLATGGRLSTSELADAQQSVRSAYAARGLNDSNSAIGAEVLATDAAQRAKLDRARQFAAGVDASGQQQLNAGRAFASDVEGGLRDRSQYNAGLATNASATNASAVNAARQFGANAQNQFSLAQYSTEAELARTNAAAQNQFSLSRYGTEADTSRLNAGAQNQFLLSQYGTQAGLAQSNAGLNMQTQLANMEYGRATTNDQFGREFNLANMYAGQAQDPYQMVLGRSGAPAAGMGAVSGAGFNQSAGPTMFDPFNAGIMSMYAGNQANQLAANTATANNRGSQTGSIIGGIGTVAAAKIMFMCLPEGQAIDTPSGPVPVESVRAGDTVTGWRGTPVLVKQKHEYAERPEVERFLRFELDDGATFKLCDRHRIQNVPASEWEVGEKVGGRRIMRISAFGGVRRSYDLLTDDPGYQLAGVPVDSMIEEMAAHAVLIAAGLETAGGNSK